MQLLSLFTLAILPLHGLAHDGLTGRTTGHSRLAHSFQAPKGADYALQDYYAGESFLK